MTQRTLDRLPLFDEKSRAYPIRTLLPSEIGRSYNWRCDLWLDQGQEGACVLFAWGHEAAARPVVLPYTNAQAFTYYNETRENDGWPMPHDGTSVLAGAQTMQRHGYLDEYRWGFSVKDDFLAVGYKGPGVYGINWYTGMFHPDSDGFLHVTGQVEGGHGILAKQTLLRWQPNILSEQKKSDNWWSFIDRNKSYFVFHNSWGQDWGQKGEAKISVADMERLRAEDGEFCIPVRRRKPVLTP